MELWYLLKTIRGDFNRICMSRYGRFLHSELLLAQFRAILEGFGKARIHGNSKVDSIIVEYIIILLGLTDLVNMHQLAPILYDCKDVHTMEQIRFQKLLMTLIILIITIMSIYLPLLAIDEF